MPFFLFTQSHLRATCDVAKGDAGRAVPQTFTSRCIRSKAQCTWSQPSRQMQ